MNYYKIRNKNNKELFRQANGTWSKDGKVYTTIGKLRSMLTSTIRGHGIPDDWEIVEFEVFEKSVKRPDEVLTRDRFLELLAGHKIR